MNETEDFFKQLKDEDIILVIKSGDYFPFEVLFQRYVPLVKKVVKDYYIQSFEMEDFIQEARIVFNKAIHLYDNTRGHTFGNYFKMNLKHHFFSLIRKDMAKKRRSEKISESLEGLLENGFSPNYIKNFSGDLDFQKALEVKENIPKFFEYLSEFERQIFFRYLKNVDKEEIAKEFTCEVIQVTNGLDRCKRKMKIFFN
ncbi:sigma-70 family RNA polymerase sigma factor [Desemzia sp. RIT804]|uniref:sigma-70 family RNA polymerase sigma factor n=1 Tax=Desemzia sp. RIT 804 TaxID=2810209 RepID=UPI00194DD54C|nr:sigma-70 family RNA polymerase sigma factor [Desemzia sp. RIT 804]